MHNIYLAKTRCANLGATVLGAIVSRDVVTVTMFVTLASFVAWFRFDFGDDDIFFPPTTGTEAVMMLNILTVYFGGNWSNL